METSMRLYADDYKPLGLLGQLVDFLDYFSHVLYL